MIRALAVLGFALAALVAPLSQAGADDTVTLSKNSSLLGEHIRMQIRVLVPTGATVELTPGTASWANVELVGVDEITQLSQADGVLWFIDARVAPFIPGTVQFAPTVSVIQGSEATTVVLPAVSLTAVTTLAPDAELVLSPLAPPTEIPGAESPFLKPAIVIGGLLGSALSALFVWVLARWMARRLGRAGAIEDTPFVPPTLDGAEHLLTSDPVGAYRLMSSVVKVELARRHGLRATALTTTELRRRLDTGGDRWQARLVGGLLEECDAVIYAGYRPALERRQADLTMAREIVEVGG